MAATIPSRDDRPDDEDDAPDPWFRPVWEDTPDEAEPALSPLLSRPHLGQGASRQHPYSGEAEALLVPLAEAQDALARLDARAGAAPTPIGDGLIARLALREAAGFLAARHAWVHPFDLALRTQALTGRFDTAAQIGRAHQAMPNTVGASRTVWVDDHDLPALGSGEEAVSVALRLAGLLRALPRRHDPLATTEAAATALGPLGGDSPDPERFAAWRQGFVLGPIDGAGRKAAPLLPPLLQAARLAQGWMEAGVVTVPDPVQALAAAALFLAGRGGLLRVVPLPFWAAWPALGAGDAGTLPRLRGAETSWTESFLRMVAEAARAGSRELDRLQAAAAVGATLTAGLDRRSRLPDALMAVLATPVLTPNGLASQLGISPQAATRLLAMLTAANVVREVTGRKSFRAFAV